VTCWGQDVADVPPVLVLDGFKADEVVAVCGLCLEELFERVPGGKAGLCVELAAFDAF